jgi:oligopeptide/dipeptide ABC transporter ATP-binding protein
MYLGRIVELAPAAALYRTPIMPYTRALLAAVPIADPTAPRHHVVLAGDPPSPTNLPPGCVFYPRCPHPRKDIACTQIVPPLAEKAPGHWAACIKEP